MTKKRSKCLFVLFTIVLVICLIACFVNFTYPLSVGGNYYRYSNFVSNIKLGEDVGNSLRIIYRADLPDNELAANYTNLKNSTMDSLKQIVQSEGYKDVVVTSYGENQILVQVGDLLSEDDNNTIISLIGNPEAISFSLKSDGTEPFADRNSISNVYATQSKDPSTGKVYYYGVVEFKDSVKDEIIEKVGEETIYIFLGETQFGSSSLNNGVVTLYSDTFSSIADAQTIVNRVKTGTLALELTQLSSAQISPSYGVGSYIFVWIALAAFVLATFVFLIVRYGQTGWLATFAMMFFIVISLFLIQSIPAAHLNFAGMIALALGFLLAVDSIMRIFETAKKYCLEDTKLFVAFKAAQKDSWKRILITNITAMVIGFVCIFMPTMSIHSFGWIMFVLPFVSVFVLCKFPSQSPVGLLLSPSSPALSLAAEPCVNFPPFLHPPLFILGL